MPAFTTRRKSYSVTIVIGIVSRMSMAFIIPNSR